MVRLSEIVTTAADAGVSILDDGDRLHMPAGRNGPWDDDVTPLRNTGHWAVLFFEAYAVTGDERYRTAAADCIDYLCRDEARPEGCAFHHRNEPGKDRCNGLVGQGWTIEALAVADRYLDDERPRSLAEEVFLLHPFDESTGLWRSVGVDGTVRRPFGTINQQFWFAAAGSLLCRRGDAPEVRRRIVSFLDDVEDTVETYRSGVVYHSGYPYSTPRYVGQRLAAQVTGHHERIDPRSVGYHSFVLYALAVLKRSLPDHPLWTSGFVDHLLEPLGSERYREQVADNEFSYGYNPTGIENALALEVLGDGEDVGYWLSEQFGGWYDPQSGLLRGGADDVTLAARLYEATRLGGRAVPPSTADRVEEAVAPGGETGR
ncbi:agl cluster protein AglQ [Halomarina salina]|uniref:Agl cluster protein AglQ n=1 Tax=Halomarina salina TaxID=1872699 RepID=A0ABD5RPW2_9EURY|nr:hypothetical protein [Halomarina salina]